MAEPGYVSTRGARCGAFENVLLAGLAPDGGLAVPAAWPRLDPAARGGTYPALAGTVLEMFGAAPGVESLAAEAYNFVPTAGPPLIRLTPDLYILELFHGPTLAFKDFALQLLARLIERALAGRRGPCTLLAATSGDTGSAAIAAFAHRRGLRLVVLHPRGRISEVQRRQMTTVRAPNILNFAVEGDFDTCQALVKAAFADTVLCAELGLAAVNSINWARIAAQIVYYVAAARALAPRPVAFAVPSGNFGNVFAGWSARRIGVPIERLIVGSNRNDILARWIEQCDMTRRPVTPSLSPSMDIAVSSNVERLLLALLGEDFAAVRQGMAAFADTGRLDLPEPAWQALRGVFRAHRVDDAATLATMDAAWRDHGYLADPHTAVALAAAAAHPVEGAATVVVATAHPAKFPDAVAKATGQRPALPETLADLYDRPEFCLNVPARPDAIAAALRAPISEIT